VIRVARRFHPRPPLSRRRVIAKQIIDLAKAGERNPDLLCEGATNPS
jgi:hypothetical protein